MTEHETAPIVTLTDAAKHFGPVRALDGVSLSIAPGDCIGLVGHNGAGKSTLVNLVNGGLALSSGTLAFAGATTAAMAGVRSVFQELSLCPNLTAAENLRIAHSGLRGPGWRRAARAEISASLDTIFPGHGISTTAEVASLSIAQRQMIEIAIGFAPRGTPARLIILDEPTSSLDAGIADQLLSHIKRFCSKGGAVVFISHMLREVFEVASRIIVLKDGRIVAERPTAAFSRPALIEAMGHVAAESAPLTETLQHFGAEVLRTDQGLSARAGEIVGLSGLAGHGQAEALARLYLSRTSRWTAGRAPEVAFVARDRSRDGVLPLWSILRNISISILQQEAKHGLVNRESEVRLAEEWKSRIDIRTQPSAIRSCHCQVAISKRCCLPLPSPRRRRWSSWMTRCAVSMSAPNRMSTQ